MSLWFIILFMISVIFIIEVATLILETTGLHREVARFQAISLLTGTGFTTTESEQITKHPIRRKVAQVLILFGAFAFAIVIALLIRTIDNEFRYEQVLFGLILITVLLLFFRIQLVHKWLRKSLLFRVEKTQTLEEVYHLGEQDIVTKLTLTDRHKEYFTTLRELDWGRKYDFYVLSILRKKQAGQELQRVWIKYPTGSVTLHKGDILTLCGKKDHLQRVFGLLKEG